MNFYGRRFNLYLLLAFALALAGGCATSKNDKETAALRVHIECAANLGSTGQTVSVLRADPVLVTIARDPILTEANIVKATLLNTPGGFAVEVKFDESGTWILEQYSAANPGRHFAIFGQWGKKLANGRWLAAPLISHRIADGVLAFTPDASRDEAAQLVAGLNNVARQMSKQSMKF
jgi:preprotein translocase subunit SecD